MVVLESETEFEAEVESEVEAEAVEGTAGGGSVCVPTDEVCVATEHMTGWARTTEA